MPPTLAPAPPPIQNQDMNADNDLRAQLAAVINTPQHSSAGNAHSAHHNSHPSHGYGADVPGAAASNSNSLHHHHTGHNIDPAIAGQASSDMMSGSAGDSGGDDSVGDGRKGGKRELSQSKRAAQNRAAQRAFRQRKEGYIKKLEEQVRELHALEDNYKAIQTENYSLREYIIHLQSRLIESHGEFPQPPANVNLSHPSHHAGSSSSAPAESSLHASSARGGHGESSAGGLGASAIDRLQASAAQAVADLNVSKRHEEGGPYSQSKRFKDESSVGGESDPSEELSRQLQATAGGMPTSM